MVVAIDEEGDYSPVFSLNSNMLRFRVAVPGSVGPELRVFNEFFNYMFRPPSEPLEIPVVSGRTTTIRWAGVPAGEAT